MCIEKPALNPASSTLMSVQTPEATPVHWMQNDLCLTITKMTMSSVPPVRLSFGLAELYYPSKAEEVILSDGLMYTENSTYVNSRDALKLTRNSALKTSGHLEHLAMHEIVTTWA
ncbi:hypothetical protein AV530_018916 [Patagioenas fasciata monilis]|uniref:Uncharacterized protein n=1 Tax=Patagioenas fasciata monilis TaxID=372326 RepID=A0A1V4JKE0_PATFA|nr:hypothetical protein AV530_018916 [Patagioenas fasciata monilis]